MSRMFVALMFFSFFSDAGAQSLQTQICHHHHCLAVVDAGSTGTRFNIYAYDMDDNKNPCNIRKIWSKKIKLTFATLEPNEETIHAYLTILFTGAPETNIPVYFYATAGMRLLSQPKQQLYYQALKQWFTEQSQWRLIEAKTITGQEEGFYGWLAVNYQLGNFTEDAPLVNVMDMGGASVQVVILVENEANIDSHDLKEVDLYGRHVKLFVHSFLGLGKMVFSHQFFNTADCFAYDYQLPNSFLAHGEATSCARDVAKLINGVHAVGQIVRPVVAANPGNDWYSIGGLTILINELPFHFNNHQFTNQSLIEQADSQVCHQQWQDLNLKYPKHEYLYGYCLFASYYYALMVNGYGLKPKQPIHYLPSTENTSWTLGVVLHQPKNQVTSKCEF